MRKFITYLGLIIVVLFLCLIRKNKQFALTYMNFDEKIRQYITVKKKAEHSLHEYSALNE